MAVEFSRERWARIKEDYQAWWAGEIDRPLIHMTLTGAGRRRPSPDGENGPRMMYDESISPTEIADWWDRQYLSDWRFLGDGFPYFHPNMGPGVLATFVGGRAECAEDTVWFHPIEEQEIENITFRYDAENRIVRRVKDICSAALEYWEGLVQVNMTDLGGSLDVLSTFRPGEKLLLDLYDNPEQVRRLLRETHDAWWQAYTDINTVLGRSNPGHTAWTPIFSPTPYYMLQCDFSYMIGPAMFDEFVRPELQASCRRLGHAFYHLDGPGQLPHLDSLLAIEELDGVQWIPGAGRKPFAEWPEVYRKIRDAGKLLQMSCAPEDFDRVVGQTGSGKGLILFTSLPVSELRKAEEFIEKYGAA